MAPDQAISLRELKQRRTREKIIDTAMRLFAEHGFDGVTVTDIARHAEVGRTTFFRYFADKQEVLFADDDEYTDVLSAALESAARPLAPIGPSLETALAVSRAGLGSLTRRIASSRPQWLPLREELVGTHPALFSRQLVKERDYVTTGVDIMIKYGADPQTAALAAGIAAACYGTACRIVAATGQSLPEAVEDAFERVGRLDVRRYSSRWAEMEAHPGQPLRQAP